MLLHTGNAIDVNRRSGRGNFFRAHFCEALDRHPGVQWVTALHIAARHGNQTSVEWLLQGFADVGVISKPMNWSALEFARRGKGVELVELLRGHDRSGNVSLKECKKRRCLDVMSGQYGLYAGVEVVAKSGLSKCLGAVPICEVTVGTRNGEETCLEILSRDVRRELQEGGRSRFV